MTIMEAAALVADENAIGAEHVATNKKARKQFKKLGHKPKQITASVASQANRINTMAVRKIEDNWNRKTRHTIPKKKMTWIEMYGETHLASWCLEEELTKEEAKKIGISDISIGSGCDAATVAEEDANEIYAILAL